MKTINIYIYTLLLLGLMACNFEQKEKKALTDSDTQNTDDSKKEAIYEITCDRVGPIDRKDKELQLRMKFGETAITRDSFFLEGMYQEMITVVDKGKITELQVHWNKHGLIKSIDIRHPRSPYHLSNGIRIGSSLQQIEALNHKAVSFYGFGWDYAGSIQGFNGGVLSQQYPCFGGSFSIKEKQDYPSVLMGDQLITSDVPEVQQVSVYLNAMRIHLN